jgi:hypothetical protein
MLKFIALVLIVLAVAFFFLLRHTPRRPPRDWRHGGDDGGPVLPTSQIGLDTGRRPANETTPGDTREKVTGNTGAPDGEGGGGDGGGD